MEKNYCGADGKFSVPNKFKGIDINEICLEHDKLYRKGGTKQDRLNADLGFYNALIKVGWPKWISCCYYYAVRAYGWACWSYTDKPKMAPQGF